MTSMTRPPCSCVILAGGESKRLDGENKAFIEIGGKRVIERLLAVLRPLFSEIILVTNDPLAYLEWDVMMVTDHFNCRSSLTGIHAGIFAAANPHAMVVGCDMPFIQPGMLETLLSAIEPHLDVIIPKTPHGFEPMMAIYSKRCLKPMEAALVKKQFKILKVFRQVRVKEIEEAQLRRHDPDLISFININTPAQLASAEKWVQRRGSQKKRP
ncbi:MAG: molybdenum cofactor guanylyltransferase [Desulfobacteraceae bacterium]|jgi:molybdopterin-guanine dinucleotide biosynthesis protein A